MTIDEAILRLRSDPQYADLVRDSYLDEDVRESSERFRTSAEFAEVRALLENRLRGGKALDLGAGTGIASAALAGCGAEVIYALEPDPSEIVGRGAIRRLDIGPTLKMLEATGESIPLPDDEVDVIYARQVLHHAHDLTQLMQECARVLKRGGVFFAGREPVVDNEEQLATFLAEHPVHQMASGEHAYALDEYVGAIRASGLSIERVFGPFDTIINTFPDARTADEVERIPQKMMEEKFGRIGAMLCLLPLVKKFVRKRLNHHPIPGRLYSFLAVKN